MSAADGVTTRAAVHQPADEAFLWRMLAEAASWRPDQRRLGVAEVQAEPALARYVEGWGRTGDVGVIAEREPTPVGAAWWRVFTTADHGYGFIDPAVPELSVAVDERARGRGVGAVLLRGLFERARDECIPALSLSVEHDNPALRLYERFGFERVERIGDAWTMVLNIRRS